MVVVAVVSWNTRDLLDRCLASLRPSAEAGDAEVWVVDNVSTDGSAQMVRERHPWARLVESGENLGYGRAINLVAAQTESEWFAFSNSDIELHGDALAALVEAGEQDPASGVIAPRLITPEGITQHSVWPFPTVLTTAAQNIGPRVIRGATGERLLLRGMWNPDRARRVPWAEGAFLLVRREAWDAVGGFDPEQWMSAEDLDLGWRMQEAGWATRYEPAAVMDHVGSAATAQVWGDSLPLHWQRVAYGWMLRRRGRLRTATVGLLNVAGAGARLAAYVVFGRGRRAHWRGRVRAQWDWTRVHLYALAPRRVLERYR
jgi:GT2 family glycosyltransferase